MPPFGWHPTPEQAKRFARPGNRNATGRRSPETGARISAALRGVPKSEEFKANLRGNRNVLDATVIGECVYCGAPATMEDHVIPRSRGGPDTPDNRVPCCRNCNPSKYNKTPDEWLAAGLRGS